MVVKGCKFHGNRGQDISVGGFGGAPWRKNSIWTGERRRSPKETTIRRGRRQVSGFKIRKRLLAETMYIEVEDVDVSH